MTVDLSTKFPMPPGQLAKLSQSFILKAAADIRSNDPAINNEAKVKASK